MTTATKKTIGPYTPIPHVVVDGVEFKVCRSCGRQKTLDQFESDSTNKTDGKEPHCRNCTASTKMILRHRKKAERMKSLAAQVADRMGKDKESTSVHDALLKLAVKECNGIEGVAGVWSEIIKGDGGNTIKPGVQLKGINDLLTGLRYSETRDLQRKQLDRMGDEELVVHLLEMLSDVAGDDLTIDEAIEEPKPIEVEEGDEDPPQIPCCLPSFPIGVPPQEPEPPGEDPA